MEKSQKRFLHYLREGKVSIIRNFGSLLPKIFDNANAPATERLCREVRGQARSAAGTQCE